MVLVFNAHRAFMLQALTLGRQALPDCLPNPPVGCVLVKDNIVISQGYTQRVGCRHAEAMALSALGDEGCGVHAYVTLEPCSFQGRTPSCAQALVAAGVERVYVAMLDPDLRNAGAGIRIFRDAGIEVIVGLLHESASNDLAPYPIRPPTGHCG